MTSVEWFQPELCVQPLEAVTAEEAIIQLATRLCERGYVKESYLSAVLQREQTHPTGLPTPEIGVAIPHADMKHVVKPAVAVGILPAAVPFREMGTPDGSALLGVRVVFMLAIDEAGKVAHMLRQLVDFVTEPGLLRWMVQAASVDDLVRLLRSRINDEQLG